MEHKIFDKIKNKQPGYSNFDLSHEKLLTFNLGDLVPCFVMEVVPGDKFNVKSEILLRFAPLVAPIMHRINAFIHYFYVPNRIVWNEWDDFITGGEDGAATPAMPLVSVGQGAAVESISMALL